MAMTKQPKTKKDFSGPSDKPGKGDKGGNLPPWLKKKAPAKGTKGGKAPKSSNPFGKGK